MVFWMTWPSDLRDSPCLPGRTGMTSSRKSRWTQWTQWTMRHHWDNGRSCCWWGPQAGLEWHVALPSHFPFFALKPPVQSIIKYHTLYIYTCMHYDIYISIIIYIYVCVWYIDVYCGITFICVLRHGCHTLWIVEVTSSFGSPRLVICQLDVLLQHLRRAANVCCMLMYVLVYSTNRQVWLFCFKVVRSLLSSLFSCPFLATCLDWCR